MGFLARGACPGVYVLKPHKLAHILPDRRTDPERGLPGPV